MKVTYEKGDMIARPIMFAKQKPSEKNFKGAILGYFIGIKTEKPEIYSDCVFLTTLQGSNYARYVADVDCTGGIPDELHPDGKMHVVLCEEQNCPPGYVDTYLKVVQDKKDTRPSFLSRQRKDISGCVKDARDYAVERGVEVSIDLYYNDIADNGRQFVAKVFSGACHIPTAHFRCQDFWLAASSAHEYTYEAVNHYCETHKD